MAKEKKIKAKHLNKGNKAVDKTAVSYATMIVPWILLLFVGVTFPYDSSLRDPYLSIRFIFLSSFLLIGILWFFVVKKWNLNFRHPTLLLFLGVQITFLLWNVICISQAINIQESIYVIGRQTLFFLTFLFFLGLFSQREVNAISTFKVLTIILLIQSIVGILQAYNLAFTGIPGLPHPTGFSGNRNLYASFLSLLLPFAFYLLFIGNQTWKIISGATVGIGIVALILGQTRSAWLAFIVSVLVFQVLFLFFRKNISSDYRRNWLKWNLVGIVSIGLIIGAIFITDKNGVLRERLKNRLVSLYDFSELDATNEASRNVNERLLVWKGTLTMIQDRPWVGVAPGNWRIHFPLYGGMSALKNENEAKDYDKVRVQPHNVYLQVASETGIPGLFLFLLITLLPILAGLKNSKQSVTTQELMLNFFMLTGLFAYSTDMLFSFPQERIEHSVLIALMTGIIFSNLAKHTIADYKSFTLPAFSFFTTLAPIFVFCIILGNAKRKFEYYTMETIKYETLGNFPRVLSASEQGKSSLVSLDPVSDPMEFHAARAYMQMGQFDKAMAEITLAERYHPNSHRIFNTKAVILIQQQKYQEAIEPLQKALRVSPEYEPSLRNLTYSYYRTDQYKNSLDVLKKIDITKDTLLQKLEADLKRRLAK